MSPVEVTSEITGIRFSPPLLTASGTAGYGDQFLNPPPPSLGGFVTKGISLNPIIGNPPPRIAETPCGLLNAIGLENIGLNRFIETIIPTLEGRNTPIIVNIFGKTVEDLCEISKRLNLITTVQVLELNVSCPNVKAGGIYFGKNEDLLFDIVREVKGKTVKPLWVKLTPNVTNIASLARAAEEAGADALTVANSYQGLSVDCENECFRLGNITGGLTGPAIKPLTLYAVREVVRATRLPVIASGGVFTAMDALEYFLVGAKAVQIGTAALVNPGIFREVHNGIEHFLERKGIGSLNQWIGRLH